ncbi:MAG: 16S rRNA (guanine(527)-N(7))-methyltransferase RsmG [Eubacteriales bacterium]|nr:16S rRNA (guanine(527)-N(7))-methyltransferase RsmG [Eubacteriales bacterium]
MKDNKDKNFTGRGGKNDRENRPETKEKPVHRVPVHKDVVVSYTGKYAELIEAALKRENIEASDDQIRKLSDYMEGLLQWNEAVNLTNITDPEDFIEKHYIDSLAVRNLMEFQKAGRVLDLGTGAGFPGIPLAIMEPDKEFYLLETIGKKIKIVSRLADEIGLKNVHAVKARAEDLGRDLDYRERFDVVVSRAVADLAALNEYCLPFVKVGGYFIAYKTDRPGEIDRAKKAINVLGGKLTHAEDAGLNGAGHTFVIIKKIKATSKKFPRQAGKPTKEPIL